MKTRITKVLNFFAFNLLFFALYLNFIHKDNTTLPVVPTAPPAAAVQGTVLVEDPEKYLQKRQAHDVSSERTAALNDHTGALKLSFE